MNKNVMPKQSTMQDVARAAGVHQTTVSLALRNHPRIPEKTAKRIRAVADKMGYSPNPLVSALITSRRRRGQVNTATLGYVVGDPPEEGGKSVIKNFGDLYEGVCDRATELGYGLDILWLGDPEISRDRFHSIAEARAIHGLIIAPLTHHHQTLNIAWERFACVAYGYSMAQPQLHRICPDFYHSMLNLMERTRQAGLRRVGLVLDRLVDAKSDHFWLAAFLADQKVNFPRGSPTVPPLLLERNKLDGADAWLAKHRPEAVVALSTLLDRLRARSRKLDNFEEPQWIALNSELPQNKSSFPGVVIDRHAAGTTCVDVLTSLLYRNESGLPQAPQNILIQTAWAGELKTV
jgi:DNA-binding LacI/PurR family transcriptional regulator